MMRVLGEGSKTGLGGEVRPGGNRDICFDVLIGILNQVGC